MGTSPSVNTSELSRRGFLAGILALGAAPAIVRAESLMKVFVPPSPKIYVGEIGTIDAGFRFIEDELADSFKYDKHLINPGNNYPTKEQYSSYRHLHEMNGGWQPGSFQQQIGRAKRNGHDRGVFFVETVPADVSKIWYDALTGTAK